MTRINLEKFIVSAYKHATIDEKKGFRPSVCGLIEKSLAEQNLEYKDGQIVGIIHNGVNINDDLPEFLTMKSQKACNPEPKFKVGDWIIDKEDHEVFMVSKCLDNTFRTNVYRIISIEGEEFDIPKYNIEDNYRLWTIQDANDGDILATDCSIAIFKYTNNKAIIKFHCIIPINGTTYKWSFKEDISYLDIYEEAGMRPATKEQRDLLFSKMHEAGYEWDAEKKELRKIENTDTIKFIGKGELTEFEDRLAEIIVSSQGLCTFESCKERAKEESSQLLFLARKQIASEIDIESMIAEFANSEKFEDCYYKVDSYREGVKDVLTKIKEG